MSLKPAGSFALSKAAYSMVIVRLGGELLAWLVPLGASAYGPQGTPAKDGLLAEAFVDARD